MGWKAYGRYVDEDGHKSYLSTNLSTLMVSIVYRHVLNAGGVCSWETLTRFMSNKWWEPESTPKREILKMVSSLSILICNLPITDSLPILIADKPHMHELSF